MGFYFRAERLTSELSPVVTAGEYVSLLSSAVAAVEESPKHRSGAYQVGACHLWPGRSDAALKIFSRLSHRHPHDPGIRVMLGISHLNAGSLTSGVEHLASALRLLAYQAPPDTSLQQSLEIQLRMALLRLVLITVHARLGQPEKARRLMLDGLVL
jgi:Flp pilus assembly protein TadD